MVTGADRTESPTDKATSLWVRTAPSPAVPPPPPPITVKTTLVSVSIPILHVFEV